MEVLMKPWILVLSIILLTSCGDDKDKVIYFVDGSPGCCSESEYGIEVYVNICDHCNALEARMIIRNQTGFDLCTRAKRYCYNLGFEHCECGQRTNCNEGHQCSPNCVVNTVYCIAFSEQN